MSLGRASGVLVPLFSLSSTRSWGIGEFPDLAVFARWLELAGQSFVQLLPINEMPGAERSPYSAMTALAIDPIFIAVPEVVDFEALGGDSAFDDGDRRELAAIRADRTLPYARVRAFKDRWMRRAWTRFAQLELARGTARAAEWQAFVRAESWWLDEYTFFRALHAEHQQRAWWDWPAPLAQREPAALSAARLALQEEMAYWAYVQWIAAAQWREARRLAWPVKVFGDLPFMISRNSPDVWARQDEFRTDGTVGVPPDAFSDTGQDWGLPPWRWEVMQANAFEWMRHRARSAAALYDGCRLDHLVGLYRIYVRPHDEGVEAFFTPSEPDAQLRLGETLVTLFRDAGAELVAEDLGTVPDFVRESIARLGVPGFKVLRWERRWHDEGQPFIDPADYPETSVAMTGTHDTESLAEWWEELAAADRAAVLALPTIARVLGASADGTSEEVPYGKAPYGEAPDGEARDGAGDEEMPYARVRDALLQAALASASRLVQLPLQDIFGWRDRINTPATVGDTNWAWSVPWPVDTFTDTREPLERAATLRQWTKDAGR